MRRISQSLIFLGLLVAMTTPVLAQKGKKGKGGGDDGGAGDGTTLPPIRYRMTVADLPIPSSFKSNSALNEKGELVGYFSSTDGDREFYLFNVVTGQFTLLNPIVDLQQIPSGWTMGGALDINDHGVIVGFLIDGSGQRHPCAIDLLSSNPVVDLLPSGPGNGAIALRINNFGDILGLDASSLGADFDIAWTFNPGIYGETTARVARSEGVALDLRTDIPNLVPVVVGNAVESCDLSEAFAGQPAQIAGLDSSKVPFRYTVGGHSVELFPELTQQSNSFAGISMAGTFAGEARVVVGSKGKKVQTQLVNYRFNPDIDVAYQNLQTSGIPEDINNLDEILFRSAFHPSVFRDWGDGLGERSVLISDILVGDDSAQFDESVELFHMNDNGVIVGFVYGVANEAVVILTPEPVVP